VNDVGLDHQVLVDELGRVAVVGVNAADFGGGQVNLVGAFLGKEGIDGRLIGEVEFGVAAGEDLGRGARVAGGRAARWRIAQLPHDGRTDHAAMAGDVDPGFRHAGDPSFVMVEGLEAGELDQGVAPGRAVVGQDHFLDQLVQAGGRRPAEFFARLARVTE
jgi:hypothetical protein